MGKNGRDQPAMEQRRVKVGVFGVGSLGQHHARIYSEIAEAELVGLCDVSAERADEVARAVGARAFTDADELAAGIEAASIAVPTDRHFEVAERLMKRGIHLLVEKPIAASTSEAEAMVAMAEERDLLLQVGHVERFNPVIRFLEQQLSRPRFIEAIRLSPYPPPRPGGVPRGTEVSVVLDLMIHDLDIILHLVRSPLRDLHAIGVPVLSSTEDIVNVRMSFENGCVANVTASRISQERMRKVRVFQEDTYVSLDYLNQSGQLCRKAGPSIEVTAVPLQKGEPLRQELDSFIRCVLSDRDPVVTGRHGSAALKLAVDVCRCLRENPS
jgi:predicted dehydrogenase